MGETQLKRKWGSSVELSVPAAVREKTLGKSRISSSRNDGSLYQPWVKIMGQVRKIFVDRIGLT